MNKEKYQSAFSWVAPSDAAMERAINQADIKRRARPRLGMAPLAAALAVVLLTGSVFAAASWIRLRGAEDLQTQPLVEKDSPVPQETLASVNQVLELSPPGGQTYVGFTLPKAYHARANTRECHWLRDQLAYDQKLDALPADVELGGVLSRYYGTDADGNWLTIEILGSPTLSRDSYFTRGSFTVEKEETVNGYETAWITYTDGSRGESRHLFCKSVDGACVLMISSTSSFDAALQALESLTLVETGIPMDSQSKQSFALCPPELGEDWILRDDSVSAERYLLNATLADQNTDLSARYLLMYIENKSTGAIVSVRLNHFTHEPVHQEEKLIRELEFLGLPAVLVESDESPVLRLYNESDNYCIQLEVIPRDMDWDAAVSLMEEVASKLEVVSIGIAEEAPMEFAPFSVG